MKMELFPNFAGIQKYIINGDRFDEVEHDSNYAALIKFINLKYGMIPKTESEVCQHVKDIVLDSDIFEDYLEYCNFNLYELIVFLSKINSKKIFTTKIIQCLKERHGNIERRKNSSGVRLERPKKNQGRARKTTKPGKIRKAKTKIC